MKIGSLKLENFRGIQELKLDFDTKSTVILGINGVGKSSILRSLDLLYANIIAVLMRNPKHLAELQMEDIYFSKARATIYADFVFTSGESIPYQRSISVLEGRKHSDSLKALINKFETSYVERAKEDADGNIIFPDVVRNMPIFVNYGVNRLVLDVSLEEMKKKKYDKLNAFDNAIESKIDFAALFDWFRIQEDLENQRKVRGKNMEYENHALKAVRKAMVAMLDGFDNIHIEREAMAMVVEKNGVALNLNQLSDGEKCTLALFGDIARRLAIANPVLADPLEGSGVVLIDELDLHMHTQWQRKVLSVLKNTFPNIQFIVTTHSPQILGEVNEEYNIFLLKKDKDSVCAEKITSLYGWDSNVILEEIMDTTSLSAEVKSMVKEMYRALDKKEYDKAEAYADMIDRITKGRNDSVAGARVRIARGRRNEKNK